MCGRYAAARDVDQLIEEFEIDEVAEIDFIRSWNVAPTDPVPAIVDRPAADSGELTRRLVSPRWGLVPSWAKNPSGAARLINARAETVAEKPSFRKAFATRRALIPADGYFEWYAPDPAGPPAPDPGRSGKQAYFLTPSGEQSLPMAGLIEFWADPTRAKDDPARWLMTCAVITTTAPDAFGHIHDRMPMAIAPAHWDDWLDPALTDAGAAAALMRPAAELGLTAYPVSARVGSVRNNDPALIAPLAS